jgi:hypothetical protein
MPVGRKLTKAEKARLEALPRDPEAILQGSMRPIDLEESSDVLFAVGPMATLWLDGGGEIRGTQLIGPLLSHDDQVRVVLDTLVEAIAGDDSTATDHADGNEPMLNPLEVLPARIVVDTPELLRPLRAALQPLGIPVELEEELPAVDVAMSSITEFLRGALEVPNEPFEWEIDAKALPPLFRAAASVHEHSPWEYLPDNPPMMVTLGSQSGEAGENTLFASILGAAGEVEGVAFYFSVEGMRKAMEAGERIDAEADQDLDAILSSLEALAEGPEMSPRDLGKLVNSALLGQSSTGEESDEKVLDTEDSVVVFFDAEDEVNPNYLAWLEERKLTPPADHPVATFLRTRPGGEIRPPDEREVRTLTAALSAVGAYFAAVEKDGRMVAPTDEPRSHTANVSDGTRTLSVTATYPPSADVWPEEYTVVRGPDLEPEEPATPEGARTLYRFQVTFDDADPLIWRRIELRGDQTLHDLHLAIQDAFGWDNDHLYAFFLSRKAWDSSSEYASPYAEDGESAAAHRLEHLPLKARKKVLYIFDFGDELRHTVTVEAIVSDGVDADKQYPRITERHGENVPQYPDEEEWDDEDLEGLEDGEDEE